LPGAAIEVAQPTIPNKKAIMKVLDMLIAFL